MANKKYIFTLPLLFAVLPSCVGTNGMDYYSQEAYAERGAFNQDAATPAYTLPRQQAAQGQQASQAGQVQQNFQNQQQAFALSNTNNYSTNETGARSVNQNDQSYTTYLAALSEHYAKYANYFGSKGLGLDANLLDAKAQTTAQGYDVVFETEDSFDIPLDKKSIIAQNRKTLENIKSNISLLQAMPVEIAKAQSSFDCSILEARNRMYSSRNMCSIEYYSAINTIQKNAHGVNVSTSASVTTSSQVETSQGFEGGEHASIINARNSLAALASKGQKASRGVKHKQEVEEKATLKYKNHKSFVVYYGTGSANLDANAVYAINRAIEFAQDYDKYSINVLGFTDRVSSRDYNKSLAQKRSGQVRNALIERGIPQNLVQIKMFGEDYNAINTRDGVGESFNRRVVIEVDVSGKFDEETFIMQKASENVIVE